MPIIGNICAKDASVIRINEYCLIYEKERSASADCIKMVMAKGTTLLKSSKKKTVGKNLQKKRTRAAAVRMVLMILIDIVGIYLLNMLATDLDLELAFHNQWLMPLTAVFGVLSALALIYQAIVLFKKIDTRTHFVTPAMLLCITLFCLIACLLYDYLLTMTLMIASVVGTVLFVVYCLYMHIFYR